MARIMRGREERPTPMHTTHPCAVMRAHSMGERELPFVPATGLLDCIHSHLPPYSSVLRVNVWIARCEAGDREVLDCTFFQKKKPLKLLRFLAELCE